MKRFNWCLLLLVAGLVIGCSQKQPRRPIARPAPKKHPGRDVSQLATAGKDKSEPTIGHKVLSQPQPNRPLLVPQTGHSSGVTSVAFSHDAKNLASGSWDKTVIIWDVGSGQAGKTLMGHTNWVYSVSFSPDGKKVASGSNDTTVIIWDLGSGQAEMTLKGHTNWVRSVPFSPDGKKVASGSDDNTVIIWDIGSGQAEKTLKGQ